MKFYIKNMVCDRCKMVVKAEFEQLGLDPILVVLGEVETAEVETSTTKIDQLAQNLKRFGFELLANRKEQLVAQVKAAIIEMVHYTQSSPKINVSHYLSEKLNLSYASLSTLFSETAGLTIERYLIEQKIERVKELLLYNQLSLSEIANDLNYSSVAHLSAQFKKVNGQTPSSFKEEQLNRRKSLDQL